MAQSALDWLRDVGKLYLPFSDEAWSQMLYDRRTPRERGAAVVAFVSGDSPAGTCLTVYATETWVEVPVTVTVQREVPVEDEPSDEQEQDNGP
jgi:hypothetical protein